MLGFLPELTSLLIEGTQYGDEIVPWITELHNLSFVDVQTTSLSETASQVLHRHLGGKGDLFTPEPS